VFVILKANLDDGWIERGTIEGYCVQFETDSTICAIATGREGALRGAIRISGPNTREVLGELFPSLSSEWNQTQKARRFESELQTDGLGVIQVAVFYWPGVRSYTGQPSAELHLIGAPVILEQVQGMVLAAGARTAQPGEFTLRAFLAGRMDLTQCEAVLGVIHAQGERAFQVALQQLAGGLATPLKQLRRGLIELLADLEAGLDFVDEDIEFVDRGEVIRRLVQAETEVNSLVEQIEHRRGQSVEFQVVLVGVPNAGKSSLVNAIAKKSVSIISDEPGTTRDYVRTRLEIGSALLDLLDTAGLESLDTAGLGSLDTAELGSLDTAELGSLDTARLDKQDKQSPTDATSSSAAVTSTPRAIAQEKTWEQLNEADLIILCVPLDQADSSVGLDQARLQQALHGKRVWGVRTKLDCWSDSVEAIHNLAWPIPVERTFCLSSVDRRGIDELMQGLEQAVGEWREESIDVVPMTGVRCREALVRGLESLRLAKEAAVESVGEEIIAGELRVALDELGQVAGTVANNDILDALFSRFCIGK
jgi:tRNA modification GTPase